jgi:hypothetical protein
VYQLFLALGIAGDDIENTLSVGYQACYTSEHMTLGYFILLLVVAMTLGVSSDVQISHYPAIVQPALDPIVPGMTIKLGCANLPIACNDREIIPSTSPASY